MALSESSILLLVLACSDLCWVVRGDANDNSDCSKPGWSLDFDCFGDVRRLFCLDRRLRFPSELVVTMGDLLPDVKESY